MPISYDKRESFACGSCGEPFKWDSLSRSAGWFPIPILDVDRVFEFGCPSPHWFCGDRQSCDARRTQRKDQHKGRV